jgi:hypothetical protein
MRNKDTILLEEAYNLVVEYDQNAHNDRLRSSPYAPKPENPNKEIPYALKQKAIKAFAAQAHEEWRNNYKKTNGDTPRVKKNSDGTEGDINVPFEKLHPDWQKENLGAGKAALEAVSQFPNDIEKGSDYIHSEWMKRNPKSEWNAAQHIPYENLSEEEKEKDRVHYRTISKLIGRSV